MPATANSCRGDVVFSNPIEAHEIGGEDTIFAIFAQVWRAMLVAAESSGDWWRESGQV